MLFKKVDWVQVKYDDDNYENFDSILLLQNSSKIGKYFGLRVRYTKQFFIVYYDMKYSIFPLNKIKNIFFKCK